MEELSKDIGLNFNECSKVPNTMAAHALLQFAREVDQSKQEQLSEALYKVNLLLYSLSRFPNVNFLKIKLFEETVQF